MLPAAADWPPPHFPHSGGQHCTFFRKMLAEFAESTITFPNPLHPKHIPHLTCCQRTMAHTASEPKSRHSIAFPTPHSIAFPTPHSLLCEHIDRNHQITSTLQVQETHPSLPPSLPSAGECWQPGSRGSCGSGWRCPGGCAAARSWGCWAWWRSPAGAAPGPARSARRSASPRPARTASGEGHSGAAAAASAAPSEAGAAGAVAVAAWHKGQHPVLSLMPHQPLIIIIIIMYIYHALINALGAHMIHINWKYSIHM